MEIKDFLKKAQSVNTNAFASAKLWKQSAIIEIANSLNCEVTETKKIRRVLRKIRENLIAAVLQNSKNSEQEFLEFMQKFLISETSSFEVSALLSGRTISESLQGNLIAQKEVENATQCLKKVQTFFESQIKRDSKKEEKKK